jgi:hypothetical protein
MVAVLGALLLFPSLMSAQEAPATVPSTASPVSPEQDKTAVKEAPQSDQEAPIEPVLSGPYPVMGKAAQDRARQIFQMFNHTQTGQMWASLSEGLRKRSVSEARFTLINKKLEEKMGPEKEMLQENFVPAINSPDTIYSRLSNFEHVRVPVICVVTINQKGQVDGFTINPMPSVAEGRFAGYHDTVKLRLPFNNEWLVYQGGRNAFDNGYAVSDELRFALDFVYTKDRRMLFSGAGGLGSKNEDYYCFGQPLLAPADGTVVRAEQGYDDNLPGKPTGDPSEGNVIVINHGNGESSMMDHLKQNSLKVKRGDKVKQGDVIAECGNSGSGLAPHVHYELQRTPGQLLPAQFVDYIADGKPVASGEPRKGQFVKNGPTSAPAAPATPASK